MVKSNISMYITNIHRKLYECPVHFIMHIWFEWFLAYYIYTVLKKIYLVKVTWHNFNIQHLSCIQMHCLEAFFCWTNFHQSGKKYRKVIITNRIVIQWILYVIITSSSHFIQCITLSAYISEIVRQWYYNANAYIVLCMWSNKNNIPFKLLCMNAISLLF